MLLPVHVHVDADAGKACVEYCYYSWSPKEHSITHRRIALRRLRPRSETRLDSRGLAKSKTGLAPPFRCTLRPRTQSTSRISHLDSCWPSLSPSRHTLPDPPGTAESVLKHHGCQQASNIAASRPMLDTSRRTQREAWQDPGQGYGRVLERNTPLSPVQFPLGKIIAFLLLFQCSA